MASGREVSEDRRLVEAFLGRGDEVAFRALYRRHSPSLYRLAVRLVGTAGSDAEDVIQDTWLRAARGLAGFRWDSSLRSWLCGIAINRGREELRRRARPGTSVDDRLDDLAAAASARPERRIDLERAVSRLPDGYRTVLVLHDIEGHTHEEIARHLEIDPGTSKSQLSRARRRLRSLLGGADAPIGMEAI